MNERIRELAVMANPSSKEIYEADNWQYNCAAWDSNNLEKFAELIVKECCDIADEVERADMDSYVSKYIKAHFGVKE
jgi:hypothetical protein